MLAVTKPALAGDYITARKAHLENVRPPCSSCLIRDSVTISMLLTACACYPCHDLLQIFLVKALFSEANPQPVKKVMELLGKCSCAVRAPLTECEPSTVEKLQALLKEHKLL